MKFWGAPGFITSRLAGEAALAWAPLHENEPVPGSWPENSWLVGTREALHVLTDTEVRLPWEEIQSADWDPESDRLVVRPVTDSPVLDAVLTEPGRLLELIRERITASVVLQRPVPFGGVRGVSVVARKPPQGGPITWLVDYPARLDPAAPGLEEAVQAVFEQARQELD